MKASNTPVFVVLIAIAGILFYGYFYLLLPKKNAFEEIQQHYPKEQKTVRQLLKTHQNSIGKGKNQIENSEIRSKLDSTVNSYIRDTLQFEFENFIGEVSMQGGGNKGARLIIHSPFPDLAKQGFHFSTFVEKEKNEPLFNKIKTLEYPATVKFSGKINARYSQHLRGKEDVRSVLINLREISIKNDRLYAIEEDFELHTIEALPLKE